MKSSAQQRADDPQSSSIPREGPPAAPDLADLVPAATELSSRLAALEKKISDAVAVSEAEKRYAEIMTSLDDHARKVQSLKDEGDYEYSELIELKTAILA